MVKWERKMGVNSNLTIVVASGKGGTGKTTIATNLARALSREDGDLRIPQEMIQLIDCDVEEPNSHLFLRPELLERKEVYISIPEVDGEKCIQCARCSEFCVYNALAYIKGSILIFPELCHGCGGCSFICPAHAISESQRIIGWIDQGKIGKMEFLQGELKIGTPLAPPIIKQLKEAIDQDKLTIIDAPPGTSCSVVSSLYGADYVILVTEPTPFGLNDLKLAYEVVQKMQIPCGVVINRADLLSSGGDISVEDFCREMDIPILLRIPFNREYASCYARGDLLVDQFPDLQKAFIQLFMAVCANKEGMN